MRFRPLWVRIPPAAMRDVAADGGRSSPTGRGGGLKPRLCGFESRLRHESGVRWFDRAAVAQLAEALVSKTGGGGSNPSRGNR